MCCGRSRRGCTTPARARAGCSTSGAVTGRWRARLAAQGALVTGVDPSPAAIERARAAHPEMNWALPAEDGRLPAPDASFDVVTCVNVLEHVADTQTLMSEVRRVLVSGGCCS